MQERELNPPELPEPTEQQYQEGLGREMSRLLRDSSAVIEALTETEAGNELLEEAAGHLADYYHDNNGDSDPSATEFAAEAGRRLLVLVADYVRDWAEKSGRADDLAVEIMDAEDEDLRDAA